MVRVHSIRAGFWRAGVDPSVCVDGGRFTVGHHAIGHCSCVCSRSLDGGFSFQECGLDAVVENDPSDGNSCTARAVWAYYDPRALAFIVSVWSCAGLFRELHPSFHPDQRGRLVPHPGVDVGGIPFGIGADRIAPDRCSGRSSYRASSASRQPARTLGHPCTSEAGYPLLFRSRSSSGLAVVVAAGQPDRTSAGNEIS